MRQHQPSASCVNSPLHSVSVVSTRDSQSAAARREPVRKSCTPRRLPYLLHHRYLKYTGFVGTSAGDVSAFAAASSLSHTSKKYSANFSSDMGSLSICMRSRTNRRCGEVYKPVLRGCECPSLRVVYCDKMEETNALVDPLPLVPAICTGLNLSKSEGLGQR